MNEEFELTGPLSSPEFPPVDSPGGLPVNPPEFLIPPLPDNQPPVEEPSFEPIADPILPPDVPDEEELIPLLEDALKERIPPSLSIATASGDKVNEVKLIITSASAADETVSLAFNGLPTGLVVRDSAGNDVSSGIPDYNGSQTFILVLPIDQDAVSDITVTATGITGDGGTAGQAQETVEIAYDVASVTDLVTFTSMNQNMWGNFNGFIGWHEYIPFIGEAPIEWNEQDQNWDETNGAYWRSGEFNLIDVNLNSSEIMTSVGETAVKVIDDAWKVFTVASTAVDTGAKAVFDAAKAAYDLAKDTFEVALTAVDQVALAAFNDAKLVYEAAKDAFYFAVSAGDQAAINTFNAAKSAFETAEEIYEAAGHAFHVVAQGIFDEATEVVQGFRDAYNAISNAWYMAIPKAAAWTALQAAELVYDGAEAAYDIAKGIWNGAEKAFDIAEGIFNAAETAYEMAQEAFDAAAKATFDQAQKTFDAAKATYETVQQGIYNTAMAAFEIAQGTFDVAEATYEAVKQGIYDAAEATYKAVEQTALNVVEAAELVELDTELQLNAELFANAGLKIDFELDLGSVDTNLDYQLTSQTQYNQTTDMLAITPMMTNMTDGDSVAFSTISPNAKFYAGIIYEVGADIELFVDGRLSAAGVTFFDLSPDTDGITVNTTLSTNSWNDLLDTIPEQFKPDLTEDIKVGELVLIDFDSTEGGPYEVPFIEQLTNDILSIELNFPTIETEGVTTEFSQDYYQEGGFVTLDISEITDAFLNLINAKLDYSDELKDLYNLPALGDNATLDEALTGMAVGMINQIWDVLDDFQSEGAPVFVLDATDETSSSLLHINLYPDDLSTIDSDTASFGFYAAYGESEPIVKVNIDIDAAVAQIVDKVAEAALAGAPIPDFNPLNIEFGIEQVLKMVEAPKEVIEQITNYVDLGFTFEAADLDAYAAADVSQEFTLSIDDMMYQLTLEDGSVHNFDAGGESELLIGNASTHDADGNDIVDYSLAIVPEAMFSNDTEIGLSMGYVLDFLKGEFAAGLKLPLNELLGIDAEGWPDLELPMVEVALGPLLRIEGEMDLLDVDIFESRFSLDVGAYEFTDGVDIELLGTTTHMPDGGAVPTV